MHSKHDIEKCNEENEQTGRVHKHKQIQNLLRNGVIHMHEILPEITKSRKSTFGITNTFHSEKSNHKFRKLKKVINLLNNRVSWIRSKWIRICLQITNKIIVNECDHKCN